MTITTIRDAIEPAPVVESEFIATDVAVKKQGSDFTQAHVGDWVMVPRGPGPRSMREPEKTLNIVAAAIGAVFLLAFIGAAISDCDTCCNGTHCFARFGDEGAAR